MTLLGPVLVTTAGDGSMDRYGQQLAAHLPDVPSIALPLAQLSAGQFNARRPWAGLHEDARAVALLRRTPGLLHFTHHHTARYALTLRRPYVVTVHDLIRWHDVHGPEVLIQRPSRRDRALLALDYRAVRQATAVIAVSEHTAGEVVRILGVPRSRVHVVPQAIDHGLFRPTGRRLLDAQYVLFVGSEHPRKDLPTLLRALARVRPEVPGLRLVKVGTSGDGSAPWRRTTDEVIDELGLRPHVVFAEQVPDADLPAWYSGAACLVLPSLAEGFGLPPLEAMACGCPVIVSTAGALPEVTGGAALTVPPRGVPELADVLRTVLTVSGVAPDLRERGLRRVADFTWSRTAEGTRAVYDALGAATAPAVG